jgi:hypothetical protein
VGLALGARHLRAGRARGRHAQAFQPLQPHATSASHPIMQRRRFGPATRPATMSKTRIEAFSDAVIAIVITIMVLELKIPHGDSIRVLAPIVPVFLTYVLSYVFLGIYWNNHHHCSTPRSTSTARSCGRTCTSCSGSRWCRS